MSQARSQLIQDLKDRLLQIEGGPQRSKPATVISTGAAALDQLLPDKGLAGGTLLEWVSASEGSGAITLALVLAARVQERGGAVVVIDEQREFNPPAAQALGLALPQTLVVQPAQARDVLWAWEQSLRSPAVAVVLGGLTKIDDRAFRRLQLAAETGGSLGFLWRPASCRAEPSWAAARLLVEAVPSGKHLSAPGRRLRIEMLHRRGGFGGEAIEVELSDAANTLHLVPTVADSAPARRAAGG